MKRIRPALPFLIAAAAVLLLALACLWGSLRIRRCALSQFDPGGAEFCFAVEQTERGRLTGHIAGYCFSTQRVEEFYNFGQNLTGHGEFLGLQLALVQGDSVYLLPGAPVLRMDVLGMPQAAPLARVERYGFFAGVESKFYPFLLKSGSYRIAFVYTAPDETRSLLIVTEAEWIQ